MVEQTQTSNSSQPKNLASQPETQIINTAEPGDPLFNDETVAVKLRFQELTRERLTLLLAENQLEVHAGGTYCSTSMDATTAVRLRTMEDAVS